MDRTNLVFPGTLANAVNASFHTTFDPTVSFFWSEIPNASASRALRFLTSQSLLHVGFCLLAEQGTMERKFPQGQASVTVARQDSVSGQAAGA